MLANLILTQYLGVVMSTPLHLRRKRFCLIDELPVFSESCGPLLEEMCRQIRKFQTSFVFMHQGSSGFPMRQQDPFLMTILDMCREKSLLSPQRGCGVLWEADCIISWN